MSWSWYGHFSTHSSTQWSNYYSVGRRLSIIDKKYTHNLLNLGFLQIYIIQNILIGFWYSTVCSSKSDLSRLNKSTNKKYCISSKKYGRVPIHFRARQKRDFDLDDFGHLSLIQNDSYFQIAQNQIKSHKSSFELNLLVVLINNPKFRVKINRTSIIANLLLPRHCLIGQSKVIVGS